MTDATTTPLTTQQNQQRSIWARNAVYFLIGALLSMHVVMAVSSIWAKSSTFDEVAYIAGGYSYWKFHDYRLQPENGILPQRLIGLPVLASRPAFPQRDVAWQRSSVWNVGPTFLYHSGNDADKLIFRARLVIVAASVLLGVLVFLCARDLFSPAGGVLALAIYCFSPSILAHARIASADIMTALTMLLTVVVAWRMYARLTWWTLLGGGVALGLLMLTKVSGVLAGPMLLLMLAVRLLRDQPLPVQLRPIVSRELAKRWQQGLALLGALVVQAVMVVVMIWGCYGFRYAAFAESQPGRDQFFRAWEPQLQNIGVFGPAVSFAREYQLLPEAYLYGFTYVLDSASRRRAFLNGRYSTVGWPEFYPYAFAVKTALPVLLLLVVAAGAVAVARRRDWREFFYRTSPLWILMGVYIAAALRTNLNIGHRHLLVLYPPLFILAGAGAFWLSSKWRAVRLVVPALVASLAIASLSMWPNYLAYFNLFAGGPVQGYHHLVDSSLDWGQDLPALKRWLIEHELDEQSHTPVYLSYFGMASPSYYGIDARRLESYLPQDKVQLYLGPPTGGYYCISANMLQQVYTEHWGKWNGQYEHRFQQLVSFFRDYQQSENDPAARAKLVEALGGQANVDFALKQHAKLWFGRLCAHLQQRQPDAQVGYSILIFRISADELAHALMGPAAQLHPDAGIRKVR